ncbi:peroxisomal membrane protein PEX16-like [Uloborus diversus]|uniref:peroxisomal membrane protein PEX16-like n=1 Tax=Uloborus diversus TaxID=327109 RepID=UPI002409682A|nr:peroxisomal membrane protein PEX16-like [Uloborus diversus]
MADQNNFIQNYKLFVTKNPLLANEIEVGLKWMSYIVAGRFSQSQVITELIHCASNLLTLLNDSILRKSIGIPVHINVAVEKLQTYLAVLEYAEVFAEIAARRLSGNRGRWFIIVSVQVVKTFIRSVLLLKYEQGLQLSPPIPPLNRRREISLAESKSKKLSSTEKTDDSTFTLKRSGRVIRTLETAPPLTARSWKVPKSENNTNLPLRNPTKLVNRHFTAEMLHLFRPLIHLLSVGAFGELSWKPWVVALGIDIASLHMLKENEKFNRTERIEINRRALTMLIYLLRSPFYDQVSKTHIINLLKQLADTIPGSGLILRPLIEYLPEWQQSYFYTWDA